MTTNDDAQFIKRLQELVAQGRWIKDGNRYYPTPEAGISSIAYVEVPAA